MLGADKVFHFVDGCTFAEIWECRVDVGLLVYSISKPNFQVA